MGSYSSIYSEFAIGILSNISSVYWGKMWKALSEYNIEHKYVTGFLINPEKLVLHIGHEHIAIEYYGFESINKLNEKHDLAIQINDYTKDKDYNLLEKIIGFEFDSAVGMKFELEGINEGLMVPTNKGMDKLIELKWNFDNTFDCMSINLNFEIKKNEFTRLTNCVFFDKQSSGLVTRRIKWIDFIPVKFDNKSDSEYDEFGIDLSYYSNNWMTDLMYQYPCPYEYKDIKVNLMNQFIEKIGNRNNSETDITNYLEEKNNQFILTMGFFAIGIHSQVECIWQSETKNNIKPDFFVVKPNGYADIVEFKLPDLKNKTVVGKDNREKFSAEISSYIAQTRVYSNYFEDPNNRKWFEQKYGFKVYKPRRYIVAGRRFDFSSDVWQEIKSDIVNVEIITFDDLIDGVFTQLYM